MAGREGAIGRGFSSGSREVGSFGSRGLASTAYKGGLPAVFAGRPAERTRPGRFEPKPQVKMARPDERGLRAGVQVQERSAGIKLDLQLATNKGSLVPYTGGRALEMPARRRAQRSVSEIGGQTRVLDRPRIEISGLSEAPVTNLPALREVPVLAGIEPEVKSGAVVFVSQSEMLRRGRIRTIESELRRLAAGETLVNIARSNVVSFPSRIEAGISPVVRRETGIESSAAQVFTVTQERREVIPTAQVEQGLKVQTAPLTAQEIAVRVDDITKELRVLAISTEAAELKEEQAKTGYAVSVKSEGRTLRGAVKKRFEAIRVLLRRETVKKQKLQKVKVEPRLHAKPAEQKRVEQPRAEPSVKKPKKKKPVVDEGAKAARLDMGLRALKNLFGRRNKEGRGREVTGGDLKLIPSPEAVSEIVQGGSDGSLKRYIEEVAGTGRIDSAGQGLDLIRRVNDSHNPVRIAEGGQPATAREVQEVLGGGSGQVQQEAVMKPEAQRSIGGGEKLISQRIQQVRSEHFTVPQQLKLAA